MSPSLVERRRALVARSQAERAAILAAAEPLVRKAAAADQLYSCALGARKLVGLAVRALAIYALFRR